jgi:hypothetical protein
MTGSIGGSLGPAAQAQLAQDLADMVLNRFRADDQASGNLAVAQAMSKQGQHLGLALAESLMATHACPTAYAKLAQELRRFGSIMHRPDPFK